MKNVIVAVAVLGAALLGAGLYFGVGLLGVRELAEACALAPFAWLGWRWWKQMKAQTAGISAG